VETGQGDTGLRHPVPSATRLQHPVPSPVPRGSGTLSSPQYHQVWAPCHIPSATGLGHPVQSPVPPAGTYPGAVFLPPVTGPGSVWSWGSQGRCCGEQGPGCARHPVPITLTEPLSLTDPARRPLACACSRRGLTSSSANKVTGGRQPGMGTSA